MSELLPALRALLEARGYAAVFVPRADEHLGEYLPPHNERLQRLTGFTGSAGMAVVLRDSAALFVDGRYTVQVRTQVDAALFEIRHLIEEPHAAWLADRLQGGDRVACDPRLHSLDWFNRTRDVLAAAGIELVADSDNLVDLCWQDRPEPVVAPALLLGREHTGEDSAARRQRIGAAVAQAGADAALVFAPDSVSWLLNVRGQDVPRLPVLQSFCLLAANGDLDLVVNPQRLPPGFHEHVGSGVAVHAEADAPDLLATWAGKTVLADPQSANAWTQLALAKAGATLLAAQDPVLLPKACKNATEVAGARAAHERDGIAVVRFLAWLDGEVAAGRLHSEAALADRLLALREELPHFHEPSFDTISAAGGNAAMCHYNHLDHSPAQLQPDSVYLVDSGGQYTDGTTDITRTVAIGTPPQEARALFTRVLKGHIALDQAVFPAGTTGTHLDILARQFLWADGRDYDHGTGHGVGSFLSVHEGPQRISRVWNATALAPGMIVSNEPGYYREAAFGMRCENLLVVRDLNLPDAEVPMLGFAALTVAPFDLRLIEPSLLAPAEVAWLDGYHARVFATLAPHLDVATRDWLQQATRPLAA